MNLNENNILIDEKGKKCKTSTVFKNPLREGAFDKDDLSKIELISKKFSEIMDILGLDLEDDSLKETPKRVAKMYVNEIFSGLNPKNKPKIKVFKNVYDYHSPLIELNIPFTSFCEHHFVPIHGKANIAYIPEDHVIGLSKLHRIVDFYARRPQVQERLTMQISQDLAVILNSEDIGVVLKASHNCISCRGVKDLGSSTLTSVFKGQFKDDENLKTILFGFDMG